MRRAAAGMLVSLDGLTESPDKWRFDQFDAPTAEKSSRMASPDTDLLERVTYGERPTSYRPTSTDEPFVSFINDTPMYVVSTNRAEPLGWQDSTLVRGNEFAEEIAELTQQPGKNIAVHDSPALVGSLPQDDLLDELTLVAHPVAGGGCRHSKDGRAPKGRSSWTRRRPLRAWRSLLMGRPASEAPGVVLEPRDGAR